MTLKVSSNKANPSLNLYRLTLRRNIGLIILITIFMLLICPGYLLIHINSTLKYSETLIFNLDNTLPGLITSITVVTSGIALLFCVINFSFLYSKSAGDVFHALPVTRNQLLLSRICASIVPLLIPIFLTYASMCCILIPKFITGSIQTIIVGMLFNILIVTLCCTFACIFIICAGSISDMILSFLVVNIGIIAIVAIIIELCQVYLLGFSSIGSKVAFTSTSPFVFAFWGLSDYLTESYASATEVIIYAVKLIIISAVSLILSCILYNKRKSEKCGTSYAFRFMYIICGITVGFVGAFGLGTIFGNGQHNILFWIFAVCGGVLAVVTLGAITDRGFKSVKKSIITGACSVAVMGLISIILVTGAFGFTRRVPAVDSVKSVTIDFGANNIKFEDPGLVTSLHQKIVDNISYEAGDIYDPEYITVLFEYQLDNGASLKRNYPILSRDYLDELLKIYKSDENIKSIKQRAEQITVSNITISEYKYNVTEDVEESETIDNVYLTPEELDLIIDAYAKDIKKATEKSILLQEQKTTEYYISGVNDKDRYNGYSLYVEDGFSNIKEVIANLKLNERTQKIDKYLKQ